MLANTTPIKPTVPNSQMVSPTDMIKNEDHTAITNSIPKVGFEKILLNKLHILKPTQLQKPKLV